MLASRTVSMLLPVTLFAAPARAETPEAGTEPPAGAAHSPTNSDVNIGVGIDPVGLAFFGPRLALDATLGNVGLAVHGRWFNAGLLARSLFAKEEADEELATSWATALRFHYYFGPGARGFHAGVGLEYLSARVEDTEVDREAYVSSWWIPQLDVGYRHRFGSWFLGGGLAAGYAILGAQTTEDLSGGSDPFLRDVGTGNQPYGAIESEFGYAF